MKRLTLFSIIFFVCDLLIKIIINNTIKIYSVVNIIPNFFVITNVRNIGAAFSILENNIIFLIVVSVVAIYLIYNFLIKQSNLSNYNIIAYSMLLGGIMGNLFDRVVYGYVIDYLSFNIFGYNFPVFNLADILIVVSVGLIILKEIREVLCKR